MNLTNTINPKIVITSHIIIQGIQIPVKTEIDLEGIEQSVVERVWSVADRHFNKNLVIK